MGKTTGLKMYIKNPSDFIAQHFPDCHGRIALLDYADIRKVQAAEKSKAKPRKTKLSNGWDNAQQGLSPAVQNYIRKTVCAQITDHDDDTHLKGAAWLRALSDFTVSVSIDSMTRSSLFGMAFEHGIMTQSARFSQLMYLDSDEYELHVLRAGVLQWNSPVVNDDAPLNDLVQLPEDIFPTPTVSHAALATTVFLHEAFHAICKIRGIEMPKPQSHTEEGGADAFAVLVSAALMPRDEWNDFFTSFAKIRLVSAFHSSPTHFTTPAIMAAMQLVNDTPIDVSTAFDLALDIAKNKAVFKNEADIEMIEERCLKNSSVESCKADYQFLCTQTPLSRFQDMYETIMLSPWRSLPIDQQQEKLRVIQDTLLPKCSDVDKLASTPITSIHQVLGNGSAGKLGL